MANEQELIQLYKNADFFGKNANALRELAYESLEKNY